MDVFLQAVIDKSLSLKEVDLEKQAESAAVEGDSILF
jgi:hypothetical protein